MAAGDKETADVLRGALRECRSALRMGVLLTVFITLSFLALPFYLMNIFARVIPTQSLPTLLWLTGITLALFLAMGGFEMLRARLLSRVGTRLDARLSGPTFDALQQWSGRRRLGTAPIRNIEAIRSFVASPSVGAFFDAPMGLLFLLVLFYFHTLLGLIGVVGILLLVGLGWLQDKASEPSYREGKQAEGAENAFAEASLRGREAAVAMGMVPLLQERWLDLRQDSVGHTAHGDEIMRRIRGWIRPVQSGVRIGVLAAACVLAIEGAISPGLLFVANILAMRAMMPAMQAMTAWKGFIGARDAYQRLNRLLKDMDAPQEPTALPAPTGTVKVNGLAVDAPNRQAILRNVRFGLKPGESLGVMGQNGSGKTTVARALVGAVAPRAGYVRLDGVDMYSWHPEDRGRYVGYLPQDVELFDGTVAQNIARFAEDTAGPAVVKAAERAGVAEMIDALPEGYDTEIREHGGKLTGGQRQRIGLARALYGDPTLVVLDEPNASLDDAGEAALQTVLRTLKDEGATVVAVSHAPHLLRCMNKVLVMRGGTVIRFGPTGKVLPNLAPAQGAEGTAALEDDVGDGAVAAEDGAQIESDDGKTDRTSVSSASGT